VRAASTLPAGKSIHILTQVEDIVGVFARRDEGITARSAAPAHRGSLETGQNCCGFHHRHLGIPRSCSRSTRCSTSCGSVPVPNFCKIGHVWLDQHRELRRTGFGFAAGPLQVVPESALLQGCLEQGELIHRGCVTITALMGVACRSGFLAGAGWPSALKPSLHHTTSASSRSS